MMYVMIGGAFGSLCRYLMIHYIGKLTDMSFPYGTMVVNILGGLIMGMWIAAMAYTMPAKAKDFHLLFAVGVLGGFTTFSTFSLDVFYLIERGELVQTGLYAIGSVVLSVLALMGGMWLVRVFF